MDHIFKLFLFIIFCALGFLTDARSSSSDKIKLSDISTLTFHNERYTTGRRSSSIPQLKCVGGSAKHDHNQPASVQCYNRGFDGFDVQWECKTQLPSNLKLGPVEVVCEGYEYPDDPYILRGSCGLEYQLEYAGSGGGGGGSTGKKGSSGPSEGFKMADLILVAIILLLFYGVYVACRAPQANRHSQFSPTDGDFPSGDYPSAPTWGSAGGFSPPPPGFNVPPGDASCSGNRYNRGGASSGAGFWTGAALGGGLGYLFGRNRNSGSAYHQGPTSYGSPGFFDQPSSSSSSSQFSDGPSTSTGFGGTRRR